MGFDLYAFQKGSDSDSNLDSKKYIGSYQIWSEWSDSDIHSWPECLQYFWWHISDYESAQTCAKNIRTYYSEDDELLRFAIWLESFDNTILFELSI